MYYKKHIKLMNEICGKTERQVYDIRTTVILSISEAMSAADSSTGDGGGVLPDSLPVHLIPAPSPFLSTRMNDATLQSSESTPSVGDILASVNNLDREQENKWVRLRGNKSKGSRRPIVGLVFRKSCLNYFGSVGIKNAIPVKFSITLGELDVCIKTMYAV